MAAEAKGSDRDFQVWHTYTVTATTYVRARSAAEAVRKVAAARDTEDAYVFDFGCPDRETRLRADLIQHP